MKIKSILIALLALVLAFPSLAGAAPVGKLTSVEGKVDITSPGKAAKPANIGDPVNVGDILRTKSKSRCEVTFGDGNILRLAESTRLKVTAYMFDKGPRNEVLNLFRGKIQNIVQKVTDAAGPEKAGRYEIHTPTAVCGVRGTNFFTFHQSGVSGAIFKEGIGYGYSLNRPQDIRTINPGQAMVVTDPNKAPTLRPATTLELDKHQQDTAPAEKKASGDKKDGDDKTTDSLTAKADDNKGGGADKKDDKKAEGDKPPETQVAKNDDSSPTGGDDKSGKGKSAGPSGAPAGFGAGAGEDRGVAPGGLPLTNLLSDTPQIPKGRGSRDNPAVQPLTKVDVPFEQGDTTPPEISFTTRPASLTNSAAATFTISSTEAKTTYSYSTDGVNYVNAAGNTISLSGLSEGRHTLYVKGTDTAGNESKKPISYIWTTDYAAPAITLSGTPDSLTNAAAANIRVTASEPATYTYTLNGQAVTSPRLANLPEGSNSFTVKATDAAGNESTKTYAWTTDYTAPGITITPAASPMAGNKTKVTVALSGNESAVFSSKLDNKGQAIAGNSFDLTALAAGDHTLKVQATDEAGNTATENLSFTLNRYALAGIFYGCIGEVSGNATGKVAGVSGQNWGGWNLAMTGTGNSTPNASWTLAAGDQNDDGSYWLSVAPGTSDYGARTLTGISTLTYLSPTQMGIGTGNVTGTFDGAGHYNLTDIGTGSYTESPLYFSGDWQHSTLYNDYGYLEVNSYDYENVGAFGFKKRPDGNYDFLAIGKFYDYGIWNAADDFVYGGPYIWSGSLQDGGQTGNGYLEGFTGGIWKKADPDNTYGTLKGYAAALYYTESGVGLVRGDLTGGFYETNSDRMSGMWKAQSGGNGLTTIDKTASLPADFDVSTAGVGSDSLYAYAAGSFVSNGSNVGTIRGEDYNGESMTKFITYADADGTKSLPFGIYGLRIGGYVDGIDPARYTGKPAGTSVSWSAKIGRDGYFGYNSSDYGYWLAGITGKWNEYSPLAGYGGTIDGNLSGDYLTRTHLGTIGGPFSGLYTRDGIGDDGSAYGTWVGESVGTYEGQKLAWSGSVDYDYNYKGLYTIDGYGINYGGDTYDGRIGGLTAPWSGTTGLRYLDKYNYGDGIGQGPYLWTAPIYSYDYGTGNNTTYDGGAFFGLTSGIWLDKQIDARIYALYVSPEHKAGILKGTLAGNYYPDLSMYQADGTWTAVDLPTESVLSPTDVTSIYVSSANIMDSSSGTINISGSFLPENSVEYEAKTYKIEGQKWGLYQAMVGGTYTGTPSDTWFLGTDYHNTGDTLVTGTETVGSQWSAKKLLGDTYGFAADITGTPSTWIGVGETIGSFDSDVATWQAVQAGVYLDTNLFMTLAQTDAGRAKLQQLNIPAIEVGKANLSGGIDSGVYMDVHMNNVTFFANSTGGAPRIWATNNVTGSYEGAVSAGVTVPLSGSGLNANFNVVNWNTTNGKWLSTVTNGNGTYSGTGTMNGTDVNFRGAAAGTMGGGSLNGTAAGVVKP